MAGIRGVRSPYPSKGREPTNIFSTKGSQKKSEIGPQYPMKQFLGREQTGGRKDPKKRDNMLKGG